MNVIGLSAKMGCGKTTLCKMIMDRAPVEVAVRLAFGDLLKQECSEYFGFPVEWCYSQEGKGYFVAREGLDKFTVREALQWYGTDFRRAQDPDYWTKAMQEQLVFLDKKHSWSSGLLVVVDDVRFLNEAQVCLDNGYCFRIEPFFGWEPGPHAGHESETALDGYEKFTEVYRPEYGMEALGQVADKIIWRVFG